MPGASCAILGCNSFWRAKGIVIFSVPVGIYKCSTKWLEIIISVVNRDHLVDKILNDRIGKKNIYMCKTFSRGTAFNI